MDCTPIPTSWTQLLQGNQGTCSLTPSQLATLQGGQVTARMSFFQKNKTWIIIVGVVLVGGVLAGAYYFFQKERSKCLLSTQKPKPENWAQHFEDEDEEMVEDEEPLPEEAESPKTVAPPSERQFKPLLPSVVEEEQVEEKAAELPDEEELPASAQCK